MITAPIRVTIPGHPKPKGSLKCIGGRGTRGHVLIEDNKGTKGWRDTIASWTRGRVTTAAKGQPIGAEIVFTLERPKGHYGTGRNVGVLRASAPAYPVGHNTGDVDKLLRLVLDALQDAGVLLDDCAVVEVTGRKVFVTPHPSFGVDPWALANQADDNPGVMIRLYPIAAPS